MFVGFYFLMKMMFFSFSLTPLRFDKGKSEIQSNVYDKAILLKNLVVDYFRENGLS